MNMNIATPGLLNKTGKTQDKRGQSYNCPTAVWIDTFEDLYNEIMKTLNTLSNTTESVLIFELNKIKPHIKTILDRYFENALLELFSRIDLKTELEGYKKKFTQYKHKLQLNIVPEIKSKIAPVKKGDSEILLDYIYAFNNKLDPLLEKLPDPPVVNAQHINFI